MQVNIAQTTLASIRAGILSRQKIISIDADFYFTKGTPGKTSGHIFHDVELEKETIQWFKNRASFEKVMARYQQYDANLNCLSWPTHYATRFINVQGNASNGENIFMFFPEVLGLKTQNIDDYFGFEFIDVWISVFDEIVFPCMRRVFNEDSQLEIYTTLRPVLEKTIYLASVFHEIGHRCGFWKVSPNIDERININKFHTDVLGELATDTLLVNFLSEFPEIRYFVFLQRLFWFGRFDFKNNPLCGKTNEDNDTWIGSYLWNQYVKSGVLMKTEKGLWTVNHEKLTESFENIMRDTDQLGQKVIEHNLDQDQVIDKWMQSRVENIQGKFILPKDMREIFQDCIDIVEKPSRKF